MNQHLRALEMSQQSRQQPASSSGSSTESAHERKGTAGRRRNDHGVPTETRTDPLWWNVQAVGRILHSYQAWDGENLILNISPKKGNRSNG